MVLTKQELLTALQKEVRILIHLAGKVDMPARDYRPTPKQRSALELLRYLSFMGPQVIAAAKARSFDGAAWTAAMKAADQRGFDETMSVIGGLGDTYQALLDDMSDDDFRAEMTGFDGSKLSSGAFIVTVALAGHAAYRTQLFCYLKACGQEQLGTTNLWRGVDAMAPA